MPIPRSLIDLLAVEVAGKAPEDLVFTTPTGRPLRNLNARRDWFDRAASDAGLTWSDAARAAPHGREPAVASEGNVKAVQRLLGHASAAMTLDVYAGLFDDDLDALADRINAAVTAAGPSVYSACTGTEVVELRRDAI